LPFEEKRFRALRVLILVPSSHLAHGKSNNNEGGYTNYKSKFFVPFQG